MAQVPLPPPPPTKDGIIDRWLFLLWKRADAALADTDQFIEAGQVYDKRPIQPLANQIAVEQNSILPNQIFGS